MKKQEKITLVISKFLLVILTLFSQLTVPLTAFAEEIENVIDENNEELTEEKTPNEIITNEDNNVNTSNEENTTNEDNNVNTSKEENTTNDTNKEDNTIQEKSNETSIDNNTTEEQNNESPSNNDEENNNNQTPDDSIISNEEEAKYVVTVNGEEVEEITLGDNKIVNIHQSYSGEDGTYKFSNNNEVIDLSHAIYGDYKYTYKVVSIDDENNILAEKNIIIHYNGDNSEILNKYTNLSYSNNTYSIRGKKTKLTAKDVLDSFNNSINSDYYIVYKSTNGGEIWNYISISVIDEENNYIGYNDEITSNSKLSFGVKDVKSLYSIKIDGDYTDDCMVNFEDAKKIVDNILNGVMKNEELNVPFSILDATNSVFTTGVWDNSNTPEDTLSSSLSNKAEAYVGEEFEVKYSLDGFEKDYINGIYGTINYNKDIIELTDISLDNIYGGFNDNNEFAYLIDNYNTNGLFITLKFKGISAGNSNISIDDIILSNGNTLNLDSNTISSKVTIIDLPKGSDVEDETNNTTPTAKAETTTTTTGNNVTSSTYIPRFVALSSDNYIKSLTIDGYKLDFDMYKYEYIINVKNSVKSLKLNVLLNDPSATYEIRGNENFKVGENTVEIIVKAENGDTRTYTIKVNRAKKDNKKATEEEKSNNAKPIIIVLIVLVIIGLIYVIFKDDEEEKK